MEILNLHTRAFEYVRNIMEKKHTGLCTWLKWKNYISHREGDIIQYRELEMTWQICVPVLS